MNYDKIKKYIKNNIIFWIGLSFALTIYFAYTMKFKDLKDFILSLLFTILLSFIIGSILDLLYYYLNNKRKKQKS